MENRPRLFNTPVSRAPDGTIFPGHLVYPWIVRSDSHRSTARVVSKPVWTYSTSPDHPQSIVLSFMAMICSWRKSSEAPVLPLTHDLPTQSHISGPLPKSDSKSVQSLVFPHETSHCQSRHRQLYHPQSRNRRAHPLCRRHGKQGSGLVLSGLGLETLINHRCSRSRHFPVYQRSFIGC